MSAHRVIRSAAEFGRYGVSGPWQAGWAVARPGSPTAFAVLELIMARKKTGNRATARRNIDRVFAAETNGPR
jgi:hypothetical protein